MVNVTALLCSKDSTVANRMRRPLKQCFFACFFLLLFVVALFADGTTKVYCSASGKKYHKVRTCRSLARSKVVNEVTLQEAQSKGLEPCKFCYKE